MGLTFSPAQGVRAFYASLTGPILAWRRMLRSGRQLWSVVLLFLCACSGAAGADTHQSRFGLVTAGQWAALDGPCNRFDDPRAFLDEVDEYVALISGHLGRSSWLDRYGRQVKIEFIHEPDGYSHVEGGYYHFKSPVLRVYLNDSFKYDRAPLAHEITHLILPRYSSLSLREGLAAEMQDRFGRNASLYSLGADVHALSGGLNPEVPQGVLDSVGRPGVPGLDLMDDEEARAAFYLLSQSFSRYLLDRFGMERFLLLYESGDLMADYESLTGRGLDALKSEWQRFIVSRAAGLGRRHVAGTPAEQDEERL